MERAGEIAAKANVSRLPERRRGNLCACAEASTGRLNGPSVARQFSSLLPGQELR